MIPSIDIRSVHLRVSDLERSIAFYAGQLGFTVDTREKNTARLFASTARHATTVNDRLVLTEARSARPAASDTAGLFHAALLLPSRAALGSWLRGAANAGVEFHGFSDHGVSEAIYLADPDGNGLEIYADRPSAVWPRRNGELAMITDPLRVPELLAAGAHVSEPPLSGAHWGHLHFRVTDLDASEAFYRETLGLVRTQTFGTSARFLAADGYHHQLGLNTWGDVRLPLQTEALGLAGALIATRSVSAAQDVKDPDGISLRLEPLHP
jgi:catechol 2,3-dioxygenase